MEVDFMVFHEANPHIYKYFKEYALKWIQSPGKKIIKISSKQIIGRIRWFLDVETEKTDFKINDAFTPHYARLFIKEFPQYENLFELRKLRAKNPVKDEFEFVEELPGIVLTQNPPNYL